MKRSFVHMLGAALLAAAAGSACSSATTGSGNPPTLGGRVAPYGREVTEADVNFMNGMILHHAQAVLMAGWAPSHGASASLQGFAERVVVAQQDEIALMKTWLLDRGRPVPNIDPAHMMMEGMEHHLHPGMLTVAQLKALNAARGVEFDRLFLQGMIEHHVGAMKMVDALFASPGAGEEEFAFRLASDIYADQSSEVRRMQAMLDALPPARN